MIRRYLISDIFLSVQGEGYHSGIPALFIRFGYCNMWDGREETREKWAKKGVSSCPLFCDTDFRSNRKLYDVRELVDHCHRIVLRYKWTSPPLIVFTGGEPLLALDERLVDAIKSEFRTSRLAVETNGTVLPFKGALDSIDHVCVSPKTRTGLIQVTKGDEIKVIWPDYSPLGYQDLAGGFEHWYVQPSSAAHALGAVEFCLSNPRWRLSYQIHKIIAIK